VFSVSARYALNVLGRLADDAHAEQGASEMASFLNLPVPYTSKILQRLRDGGFVVSRRGRGGGFRLARDPRRIRLIDVVSFLDGKPGERECLLGQRVCSEKTACVLHAYWSSVKTLEQRTLRGLAVSDLARDAAPARKKRTRPRAVARAGLLRRSRDK